MGLKIGTRLGPYEVVSPLGAGGMGEVYLARDGKLDRQVAIKVLPEAMTRDPERVARFEREAKVLASLNHPNIAAIHGIDVSDGTRFLVMEYVEGETLAQRLKHGGFAVEDALDIAKQMAEALEAAHEKGVIHRDLKPGNVMIRPDGTVKVLDFGLAKAMADEGSSTLTADSPTITANFTRPGVVLGTAAYMSPEQARGRPLDKRTDIWSFGVVLFECLTGKTLFRGETATDSMGAIMHKDPDWSLLPPSTPPTIQLLLRRCLAKDRKQRLHDISDARIELEEAIADPTSSSLRLISRAEGAATPPQALHKVSWTVAVVGAVALLLVGIGATWLMTRPEVPTPAAPIRFDFELAEGTNLPRGVGTNIAVSPDGKAIVYVAENASGRQLYLRRMNELGSTSIPRTEGGLRPFFSPDGEWVAFEDDLGGTKRVSLSGDELYPVCDSCTGGSWGDDGNIVFEREGSLWRVRDIGGEPELVAEPMPDRGVSSLSRPVVLPGNKAVLFENGDIEFGGIGVLSLESNEVILVSARGSNPIYSHTGHIIFPRGDTLVAVPFDVEGFEVTGRAVPILQGVRVENGGAVQAAVSRSGLFVYAPAGSTMGTQLAWVDRSGGNLEPLTKQWRLFSAPRLSPDGEQIAVVINDGGNTDIWIVDVGTGGMRRLTTSGDASAPVWTPDGVRVTFASGSVGSFAIQWTRTERSGPMETLLESKYRVWPEAWNLDGGQLVFRENSSSNNLFVLDVRDQSRKVLLDSDFSEHSAALSHNGKLLAYESNRGGSNEVYVRPFPGPGTETAVSIGGGYYPMWSPDDSELYYRVGVEAHFMAASLQSDPRFRVLGREKLFDAAHFWNIPFRAHYDVHPDGQRFLVLNMRSADEEVAKINVVLNWFEELKRRVPTKRSP